MEERRCEGVCTIAAKCPYWAGSLSGAKVTVDLCSGNKTKVTKWVFVLPVVLLAMPIALYFSYTLLKNMGKDPNAQEQAAQTASAPAATATIQ